MKGMDIMFQLTPLRFLWLSGLDTTASLSQAFFQNVQKGEK